MEKEKPTVLKVKPENIPDELKKLPQWTLWNLHEKNDGTRDKPPLMPNGKYASVNDPETWSTFDEVVTALPRFDGLGFVITKESYIVGIDVDNVKDCKSEKEIFEDIATLETYTEISPSGNGIRAFVKGQKEGTECHKGQYEMYDEKKVLSVTGNMLGTQKTVNRSQGALIRLCRKWFPEEKKPAATLWKPSPEMSNEEVLNHLRGAENNSKFKALYEKGDLTAYGGDESSADLALCLLISFYTQKPEQIIEIFSASKLGKRDKWIEREDYRERTVNKTLSILKKTYQPPEQKKTTKKKDSKDKESQIPEQIQQLIEEAKQCEEKGFDACKTWIKDNALQLACVDRKFWEMERNYDSDLREFVESYPQAMKDVKDAFELEEFDTATIHDILDDYSALYVSEKSRHKKIKNRLDKYSNEVINTAINELQHGDPYLFVYNAWKKQHVGDESLGKSLAVCAASTLITGNNDGLHFKPSGASGKGKTSGIDAFLNLLPPSMVIRGGISDKYIYYAESEINDGSIVFMDDRPLNENLKGVVKNSISNFQNPETHRTVLDGKPVTFTPAKRMIWIFASVDGFDDEQLANRFLMADVDSSEEQDTAVAKHQGNQEIQRLLGNYSFETDVCQCIFSLLSLKTYDVVVPFQQEIADNWNHKKNRRNQPKFRDIIKAVCLYRIFQRQHIKECTVATFNDFLRALTIYGSTAKQNNTNLTADEEAVITYLMDKNLEDDDFRKAKTPEEKRQYAYKAGLHEIAEALGKKDNQIRRTLLGRAETHSPGLDSKVQHFHYEKDETKPNKIVFFYSGEYNFEQYTTFCGNVSPEKVEEQTNEFISRYQATTTSSQKIEDKIKNQALQEAIKSLPSQCIQLFQTFPDFSRGMEKLKNDNGSDENTANIRDFSNFSRTERECIEFCDLDCKELDSQLPNFLQFKTQNIENLGHISGKVGKVSQSSTENEPTDNDFQLFQGLEKSGKVSQPRTKNESTDSDFQLFQNQKADLEFQEALAQHEAQERYSQKQDFIITPENQNAHEENLRQIALIPDHTKLDYFRYCVEGLSMVQELPTEAEERRMENFNHDYEILEKLGKVNPFNKVNEGQRVFDIFDHAIRACKHHDGKLSLNQILDKYYRDLSDRWLACFFIEKAMERGEVQVCNA